MHQHIRTIRTAALIGLTAFVAVGCGSNTGSGGDSLSGTVTVDGSSTVFPVMQAVGEEFRAEHPDVEVSVGTSGTGGGFEKFCRGETDVSNASRPIRDEEAAACEEGGVSYVELEVAIDGIAIVVNPENDFIDCITIEQLAQIWGPDSTVDNWNDVDDSYPDLPISLYGPGTDSGTFDYFTDEVNGEEGASRSDYTASEDDNVLVQGVAGDEGALGYFGHGYAVENADKVRTLEVDGGEGCVEPTDANIEDGTYSPLSRPLFIYASQAAATREEVAAFLDFTLEEGTTLVGDVGYIPLPEERRDAAIRAWKSFRDEAAGTEPAAGEAPAGTEPAAEDEGA